MCVFKLLLPLLYNGFVETFKTETDYFSNFRLYSDQILF